MLSFGVVGTSWITDSFIESAQATGKWKLAAVYSRSQKKAEDLAKKHGVSRVYVSISDMCQDSTLDAVYLASPNSLHFEHAKIALAAGKHTIVEKPITSNLKELDELYILARSAPNGAQLIEAYRHIQEKNFKILQDSLHELGPIYGGHFSFAQYSSRYNAVLKGETPNVFSAKYSGGCLVDMGVYPICFAIALFGKPLKQTYFPIMLHTGTDGGGPIVLEYAKFTITLYTSKCYASSAVSEIFGERGTLILNGITDIDSIQLKLVANKQVIELAERKAEYNLMEEAEEFHRLITEKDASGIAVLAQLSRDIVEVTEDLRISTGIIFDADS